MNRRFFLRGVAGAAVAAPFLSSVREPLVRAQASGGEAPRRLVIFYTRNGCLTDKWFPAREDGALTATDLEGTTIAGLAPYVDKLLIPRGFRSMNMYGIGQTIDPHDQANGSKLTCATISTDQSRYATAPSLDHVIAKQINPNGASPLVLSVGAASTSIKSVLSFAAPNTAFPATVNPTTVYSALTGVFGSGTSGPTEADWRVLRGQSALDLVRDDLATYQRLNMSADDQARIAAWMDLLRDTETGMMGGGGTPAACTQATAEALGLTQEALAAGTVSGSPGAYDLATSFTKTGDLMLNLMALSLICDTNRVLLMDYPGNVVFNWDGIVHTHDHGGLSNRTGDFSIGGACLPGVLDMIQQIDDWYAGKFVKLVGLLDSIQEGDRPLLDSTATLWLPELSDGAAHNLNNLPIVIAGSAGGYLKQGYAVNVEGSPIGVGASSSSCQDGGTIGNTGSKGGNVPINKLYVTLMNALGCTDDDGGPVTTFGAFDAAQGTTGMTNPGEVVALKASG